MDLCNIIISLHDQYAYAVYIYTHACIMVNSKLWIMEVRRSGAIKSSTCTGCMQLYHILNACQLAHAAKGPYIKVGGWERGNGKWETGTSVLYGTCRLRSWVACICSNCEQDAHEKNDIIINTCHVYVMTSSYLWYKVMGNIAATLCDIATRTCVYDGELSCVSYLTQLHRVLHMWMPR